MMPHVSVAVFAVAFCVEAVGLRDAARLMIATDKMHAVWVPEFEQGQEGYGFDAEEAAVHVIAEEEIIRIRAKAANLEDFDHVEELAMDVAYNGNGRGDVHDIALFHQQFFRLGAYCLNDRFGKEFFLV